MMRNPHWYIPFFENSSGVSWCYNYPLEQIQASTEVEMEIFAFLEGE